MHRQANEFIEKVKKLHPSYFESQEVLDVGSRDINGNNRKYFSGGRYTGVDIQDGKNVDLVCLAHELDFPDESYNVVISTEVFEHDIHYGKTINNMYRLLKTGGLFVMTCAFTGRQPHGVTASAPKDSPYTNDYYKNLTMDDIWNTTDIAKLDLTYEINHHHKDLYIFGFKK